MRGAELLLTTMIPLFRSIKKGLVVVMESAGNLSPVAVSEPECDMANVFDCDPASQPYTKKVGANAESKPNVLLSVARIGAAEKS
jgi:hypothetical protein